MNNVYLPPGFPMPKVPLNDRLLFIDVEASGLKAGSYPIEYAAVSDQLELFENFLIKPAAHWTDWDWESARVHNIRREWLITDGIHHMEAVDRIIGLMGDGYRFVSDNPSQDEQWLSELFHAAGYEKRLHPQLLAYTSEGISEPSNMWVDARFLGYRVVTTKHRAGPDATRNAFAWRIAQDADYRAEVSEHLSIDLEDADWRFQR